MTRYCVTGIAPSAGRLAAIMTWIVLTVLAGCSTTSPVYDPSGKSSVKSPGILSQPGVAGHARKGGGYYLDDGPGDNPPADLASVADAVPRPEPFRKENMRPYVALGKTYTPMTDLGKYKERGIASWYGRRYHGQKTASGELYDMYGMTAAHPVLPLPSYARVTNIRTGTSVVVRINDRGPFLSDRLIDLSYTAAYKLGVLGGGSALVEVESILPDKGADRTDTAVFVKEKAAPMPLSGQQDNEPDKASPALFEAGTPALPASIVPVAAATVDTAALPAGPATVDTGGIYLQLGAFSAYQNADSFVTRIRAAWPAIAEPLGITSRNGLFRVQSGPYPNQTLAKQAADHISQSLSVKPVWVLLQ